MPLRRFYARLGFRHPVAYSNATLALGLLCSMTIAVWVSVAASQNAAREATKVVIEQERQAEKRAAELEAQRQAESLAQTRASQERSRRAVCSVANRMVRVYSNPEVTEIGREAGDAWQELRELYRC